MLIGPPPVVETIRLYYFTPKQWGLKALGEKRLKVSRYADLNEPFELARRNGRPHG